MPSDIQKNNYPSNCNRSLFIYSFQFDFGCTTYVQRSWCKYSCEFGSGGRGRSESPVFTMTPRLTWWIVMHVTHSGAGVIQLWNLKTKALIRGWRTPAFSFADPGSSAFLVLGSGIQNRFSLDPVSPIPNPYFLKLSDIILGKSALILCKLAKIVFFPFQK